MNPLLLSLLSLLALSAAARPAPAARRALITNGNGVDGTTLYQYGANVQACIVGKGCSTFCTAVLVGPRVALTAAHCVEMGNEFTASHEESFIGLLFENADGDTERIVVGSSHAPPEYNDTPVGQKDIAVLSLKSVASVGPVASIAAASSVISNSAYVESDTEASFEAADLTPGEEDPVLFAVGAGLTKPGVTVPAGKTSEEALAEQTTPDDFTPGVPNVAKYNAWMAPSLWGGAIAARAADPEHVICFGDSGGPLLALGTGGEVSVVGIATETVMSSDLTCGRYSVYTDISFYKQYIDGVVSALGSEFDVVYKTV